MAHSSPESRRHRDTAARAQVHNSASMALSPARPTSITARVRGASELPRQITAQASCRNAPSWVHIRSPPIPTWAAQA